MFDFDCPCKLKALKAKSYVIAKMSPYMVHVLARSWDEIDMQDVVKAAAEKAGLPRMFAPEELWYTQAVHVSEAEEEEEDEEDDVDEEDETAPELVGDEDTNEAKGASDVKDIQEHKRDLAEASKDSA